MQAVQRVEEGVEGVRKRKGTPEVEKVVVLGIRSDEEEEEESREERERLEGEA